MSRSQRLKTNSGTHSLRVIWLGREASPTPHVVPSLKMRAVTPPTTPTAFWRGAR